MEQRLIFAFFKKRNFEFTYLKQEGHLKDQFMVKNGYEINCVLIKLFAIDIIWIFSEAYELLKIILALISFNFNVSLMVLSGVFGLELYQMLCC